MLSTKAISFNLAALNGIEVLKFTSVSIYYFCRNYWKFSFNFLLVTENVIKMITSVMVNIFAFNMVRVNNVVNMTNFNVPKGSWVRFKQCQYWKSTAIARFSWPFWMRSRLEFYNIPELREAMIVSSWCWCYQDWNWHHWGAYREGILWTCCHIFMSKSGFYWQKKYNWFLSKFTKLKVFSEVKLMSKKCLRDQFI